MSETYDALLWRTLPNPFSRRAAPSNTAIEQDTPTGHSSGRSTNIIDIITGDQSAIILAGAPHIGKSALIHYLRNDCGGWNWHNELADVYGQLPVEDIHFGQVDLTPLETTPADDLAKTFEEQCARTVQGVYKGTKNAFSPNLKGLREFLRHTDNENSYVRYFVMIDALERLGGATMHTVNVDGKIETPQDKGLALLQQCGALRMLVDLNDEFPHFGIILSIETLPRPSIGHQFSHVSKHISDDLARFTTLTLKTFNWEDAIYFLQPKLEIFGPSWTRQFKELHVNTIFSDEEQTWLLEEAGTHPYLLQQFCFYTFNFKRNYVSSGGIWSPLEETDKRQIVDTVKERLSTFLISIWNRLQEAVQKSSEETKKEFFQFLLATDIYPNKIIKATEWSRIGSELRYILSSEGIICQDGKNVRYPGSVLLRYLISRAQATGVSQYLPTPTLRRWLHITHPDATSSSLSLSELEYRLFQTLLQSPQHCTEEMLMEGAWGKEIDRTAFTQRIYQLRKKLKKQRGEAEIIENRYGGVYLLHHPERFQLE